MTTAVQMAATPETTVTVVKKQGWAKADIKRLSLNGLQAILKDFSEKSLLVRCLGRYQIKRELLALERLDGIDGVPSFLGMMSPVGILLQPMQGDPISEWRGGQREAISMFHRLDSLVADIHSRGVAHLDLRKRDNILISPAGEPSIIDFNASLRLRPDSLFGRLLFPLFRTIDRAALLKWKAQRCPAAMTQSEIRLHRRMTRLRRFWIFN